MNRRNHPSILKRQRVKRRLTQAQLASLIGTSQAQIYRLENSERKLTVEWAQRLAPALGLSVEALLLDRDDGNAYDEAGNGRPPDRVRNGRIPTGDHSVIAECLAFVATLEAQNEAPFSVDVRAGYLINLYNLFLETGQRPHQLDNLSTASIASTVHRQNNQSPRPDADE
ncbi:MAG: helix-turn-helix transcriptional regulator [Pseudomonadota bacterium]